MAWFAKTWANQQLKRLNKEESEMTERDESRAEDDKLEDEVVRVLITSIAGVCYVSPWLSPAETLILDLSHRLALYSRWWGSWGRLLSLLRSYSGRRQ